ncbi:MAG: zf-HC2 domain-containing protein [Bacteroidetes bacterium]|nr:MAG: zf-HC2 domain-containing protein [Bacteroidota bacterium]
MKQYEHPEESISAYIDGELPEEETRNLFRHLGTCGECRGTLSSLLRLRSSLLAAEREERSSVVRRLSLSYPAAAAAAVLIVAATMAVASLTGGSAASPPVRTAYTAAQPLPAVYVIEPHTPESYRTQ